MSVSVGFTQPKFPEHIDHYQNVYIEHKDPIGIVQKDRVPPLPYYIRIIKHDHCLTLYSFGNPLRIYSVSTGKLQTDTPEGIYPIVMKVVNPWYLKTNIPGGDPLNPLGSRWIGLQVWDTDGSKYGIHGTNRPELIGLNVTAGCIRMYNTEIQQLFAIVPMWTLVEIQS